MYNSTVKHGIRRLVVQGRQNTHDKVTTSVFSDGTDDDANKTSKSVCRKKTSV